MGDAAAEGLNRATSPIVGMPTDVLGNLLHGRPQERVTEDTPGAVTPRAALGGMGMSAINIGYALAPELAPVTRLAVNAGLGAVQDSDNRVRGATAAILFGETLHGVSKASQRLVRGRPVTETPVATEPIPEAIAEPSSFADFSKSVDEVAGDVAPKSANGNRKTVPGAVSDKYRLDTDESLIGRAAELLKRQEEYSSGEHGAPVFVRDATDLSKPISGQTSVARRMMQDKQLFDTVREELKARGWPESDLNDAIDEHYRSGPPDRRQAPRTDETYVWTPEERSRYITERQKDFAGKINKPWSQWTPEERQAYFADQDNIRTELANGVQPKQMSLRSAAENDAVVRDAAKQVTSRPVVDALRRIFAPANRGPLAATMGDIVRSNRGQMERANAIAVASLDQFKDVLDKMPEHEQLRFTDNMENGKPQENAHLSLAAKALRNIYDSDAKAVQDLGTGKLENPILNYVAHIWQDPAKAQVVLAQLMSKRPMEGSKSFLRQRTLPTTMDGIAAGLKPVTMNPVELALRKSVEIKKYVMAQNILSEAKSKGLLQFVRATDARPDGYVAINDPIATVSGPLTEEGARTIRGQYYAPEPVARVLNNYLSPGLRGEPVFKAYMALGNIVNQLNLGLSAYHAGFTTMEALVSKNALALMQLSDRKYGAAAKSFASTVTLAAPVTNLILGSKVLKEYARPGAVGGDMTAIVNALAEAGGRVEMGKVYKNNAIDQFTKALKENRRFGAANYALPAALEYAAKPIMEYLVPRQKLGVFADMMRHRLEMMGPNALPDEIRREAAIIWNSVDNRMGQVVYDNLFWNAAMKDVMQASIRSVGWNAGTIRELGGGALDLATARNRIAGGGRFMTPKLAYAISLPITVGMVGALINFLYTGEAPQTLDDYYHPRTGRKNDSGDEERVNLPSYIKDVIAYKRHPVQTVTNKLHPMIGIVGDMLENRDFFGDEIRNPDDPMVVQLQQEAKYVMKAIAPYGVSNLLEQRQRGQSLATQAASFVGITPASREDVRSPAENKMSEYIAASSPETQTPEEVSARGIRHEIRELARKGETASPKIVNAVKSGLLSRTSVEETAKSALEPPSLVSFKRLTYDQARRVYDLGTPEEQALWYDTLARKYHNYLVTH
jgi:hypothetical protein